jgi:hypothetical protein
MRRVDVRHFLAVVSVALCTVLGACSGQTPAALRESDPATSWRARAASVSTAGVFPGQMARLRAPSVALAAGRLPGHFVLTARPNRFFRFNYLFLSANLSGNVDAYDTTTGGLIGECQGCGGWGLATDGKTGDIAMGAPGGVITVWHVTGSLLVPYATLQLSSAGSNALGLTFDHAGNLYATDYPNAEIDEFDAATIAAGGGSAARTYPLPGFAEAYYLASDGPNVLLDGWDGNGSFIVAELVIKGRDGNLKLLQNLGSLSAGTGFPGGLSIDKHQVLLVDNQYAGTVSTFARPWTGTATSTLAWGYQPDDYTAIVLDQLKDTLWAADVYSAGSGSSSFGVANSYPLGTIGFTTAPSVADAYVAVTVSPLKH